MKKILLALLVGTLLSGCGGDDDKVEKLEERLKELESKLEEKPNEHRTTTPDSNNSISPQEEVTKLTRSNESLAWELERLRLKVVTVDGEDMHYLPAKGLWHYDLQVKPFTGRAVNMHENGKPKHDASFYEGKLDGVEKYWHVNGQLWKEKMWLEGVFHGYVTEWDANGKVLSRKRYERGKEVN